jgi:hypothetical protein
MILGSLIQFADRLQALKFVTLIYNPVAYQSISPYLLKL